MAKDKNKQERAKAAVGMPFDANPDNAPKVRDDLLARLGEQYKLDNFDRAIISMTQRYPSITQQEIAAATGYSRSHISVRMMRPAFKAAQTEYQKGLLQVLMESQVDVLKEMRRIALTDEDPQNRIAAARVIMGPLNRMEHQAPGPVNILYTVQFGEGGQIVRRATPLDPDRLRAIEGGK